MRLFSSRARFFIVCPDYDPNAGGAIVLHHLCHHLNEVGYKAYVHPMQRRDHKVCREKSGRSLRLFFKRGYRLVRRRLAKPALITKSDLNTPVRRLGWLGKSSVVIYPEVIFGNPLGANHVVRWLLHQPGFIKGSYRYSAGELYFRFNEAIHPFDVNGSKTSDIFLKIVCYPTDIYNLDDALPEPERSGTAYCVRKGAGKAPIHTEPAICIDNLEHVEVAAILRRCKYFVSYDPLTAYSLFAVLCGCISIVAPDPGVEEQQWYPDIRDRYGIAYGMDRIDWAKETAELQRQRILDEERLNRDRARAAAAEIAAYFGLPGL